MIGKGSKRNWGEVPTDASPGCRVIYSKDLQHAFISHSIFGLIWLDGFRMTQNDSFVAFWIQLSLGSEPSRASSAFHPLETR